MIVADGLGRRFGERSVLESVTLTVEPGEVVALVGPLGAGKSMLLRLLAGLLRPTAGTARVKGQDPLRTPAARARLGYLPPEPGLYPLLSARQNLAFHGRLAGLADSVLVERLGWALDFAGVAARGDRPVATLPAGQQRLLALARALLHNPEALLLDEPTSGLDARAQAAVWELVDGLRQAGKAVLLATGDLGEASRLAQRVAVLDVRLKALDAPLAIARAHGRRRLRLTLGAIGRNEIELFQSLPSVKGFELTAGSVLVTLEDPDHDAPDLFKQLLARGCAVRSACDEGAMLEDAYLRLLEGA